MAAGGAAESGEDEGEDKDEPRGRRFGAMASHMMALIV